MLDNIKRLCTSRILHIVKTINEIIDDVTMPEITDAFLNLPKYQNVFMAKSLMTKVDIINVR